MQSSDAKVEKSPKPTKKPVVPLNCIQNQNINSNLNNLHFGKNQNHNQEKGGFNANTNN